MSIIQAYETTIADSEDDFGVHFVAIPRSSFLAEGGQSLLDRAHEEPERVIEDVGLKFLRGLPSLSVLPYAFVSILVNDSAEDALRQLNQIIEDPREINSIRQQHPRPLAFAEYAAFADVIPFAASPVQQSSFAALAVASVTLAGKGLASLGQLAANPMCFLVAAGLTAGVLMIHGIGLVYAYKVHRTAEETSQIPEPSTGQNAVGIVNGRLHVGGVSLRLRRGI